MLGVPRVKDLGDKTLTLTVKDPLGTNVDCTNQTCFYFSSQMFACVSNEILVKHMCSICKRFGPHLDTWFVSHLWIQRQASCCFSTTTVLSHYDFPTTVPTSYYNLILACLRGAPHFKNVIACSNIVFVWWLALAIRCAQGFQKINTKMITHSLAFQTYLRSYRINLLFVSCDICFRLVWCL